MVSVENDTNYQIIRKRVPTSDAPKVYMLLNAVSSATEKIQTNK